MKYILSQSSLPEWRFLLMKLWFEDEEFEQVFYHSQYFEVLKWTCKSLDPKCKLIVDTNFFIISF